MLCGATYASLHPGAESAGTCPGAVSCRQHQHSYQTSAMACVQVVELLRRKHMRRLVRKADPPELHALLAIKLLLTGAVTGAALQSRVHG